MFGYQDISVDFLTSNPIAVWIAFVVLVGLGVFLYYRTNPPLPRRLRILLGVLRVCAVLALFAALLEPVISYSRQWERQKKVAVLVDGSASMDRSEGDKSRASRLDSLLSGPTFGSLRSQVKAREYYFGGNLAASSERVDREKTSLGEVIHSLQEAELTEPSDYWLLFTDGNSNSGRDPREAARGLVTPIMTVDLAGEAGRFDVSLSDLSFNPVVFVGQQTEIGVKLKWQNAAGKRLKVRLLEGDRKLDEKSFSIDQDEGLGDVTLKYVPAEPGQRIQKIEIEPLEGEETTSNNRRSFAVKALKSRLAVLVVTSRPDHEIGFLKRFLTQSDKYEIELRLTGGRSGNLYGRFPDRQAELNRFDLVVLHDPDPVELDARQDLIKSYLFEKGGAVWTMMGQRFASRGPVPWFNALLPFYQSKKVAIQYSSFHGEAAEGNLFHPVVRLADDQSTIRETWSQLPPFQSVVRCDETDPNASVLVYSSSGSSRSARWPLLGYKRLGPGKLFASAALPFWTWGFVNLGFGGDAAIYDNFLEGAISWLTVRDDFDPIRIDPEKEVFTRGELVRFHGYAYDLGFRPIPGVTGIVRLSGEEDSRSAETDVISEGEGRFTADFDRVVPGHYHYEAEFIKDGRVLKTAEGNILVESYSLEEYDQAGDPAVLMALARLSGGRYFHYSEFDDAVGTIDVTPVAMTETREVVLWNKYWLLLIFIAALSSEWLVRKINQMV